MTPLEKAEAEVARRVKASAAGVGCLDALIRAVRKQCAEEIRKEVPVRDVLIASERDSGKLDAADLIDPKVER